jgi:probable addiction module antidote protein
VKQRLRTYDEFLAEHLKDLELCAAYLEGNLNEYDKEYFLVALRNVVAANGGILSLSRKTKLNRANLYRMMSEKGNPEIMTLNKVLNAIGLRLSVSVIQKKKSHKTSTSH